jgi:antirestriction protein ArdC
LGAAFLCADLGITPEVRADHAVYLALWVEVRKAVDRTESVDGLREYL